jgi:hypothetical protein
MIHVRLPDQERASLEAESRATDDRKLRDQAREGDKDLYLVAGPAGSRSSLRGGAKRQADEDLLTPQPLSFGGEGRKLGLTASAAPSAPRRPPPR